jgi:predicted 3-demethylubiquinone-9 3-methyltransferase (glyoxalase superfamily)
MVTTQRITPCLWFNFNAKEAVEFYLSVFPNSSVHAVSYYGEAMPDHEGKELLIEFELDGQRLQALNAGPQFSFTEAVSLSIRCADQEEVDYYWTRLTDGGSDGDCGWVKDRYGLSWQIVPQRMIDFLMDPDKDRAGRAMQAMMTMRKLDIGVIERAVEGAEV